jgi:dynein heavy chain
LFPRFSLLDENYNYGSEFYGVEQSCVITSLTERCFLSMWQATRLMKGSMISGNANSGKTQTVKGMAQFMGRFLGYMYCTAQTDQQALGNFLIGLAQVSVSGILNKY